MISVASSGTSFRRLAQYLVKEREGGERVDWLAVRNLPPTDARLAARFMEATAAANPRVEAPVYHLVVSFHPDDVVTRAMMERVADRLLTELKLREHQAIIVAHKDRPHTHMHLMVNRVHPETGRAWDRWQDRTRRERVIREEERVLGLREVRGRLHQLEGQTPPERGRITSGELREAARSGVEPLVERAHRLYTYDFRWAQSWEELHARLAAHDLRIERKGQGLVLTDGDHEVKASRVHRELSFSRLQERLGPYQARGVHPDISPANTAPTRGDREATARFKGGSTEGERAPWGEELARIVDLARQVQHAKRLDTLAYRLGNWRQNHEAGVRNLEEAERRARTFSQAFDRALARVYQRPDEARERFDRLARSTSPEAAARQLFDRPESFGSLRLSQHKEWFGLRTVTETREAQTHVPSAFQAGWESAGATARLREQIADYVPRGARLDPSSVNAYVEAVTRATTRMQRAAGRLERVKSVRLGLPDTRSLETALGRAAMALLPSEAKRLALLLTDPQRALLYEAVRLARDLVLGRGLER